MTFLCPKCQYENPKGSESCERCLLVFKKHEALESQGQDAVEGSSFLKELWGYVLEDYGNREFHEKFVQTALSEKKLPYASQQYRRMIEINPADDIAIKMRDRVIQLATITYMSLERPKAKKNSRWLTKVFLFVMVVLLLILALQIGIKSS